MCTAISLNKDGHYFGRTLDLEYSLQEAVTMTPRRYPLSFRHMGTSMEHYAILGIAASEPDYPLYYDGMNERGLCMAALHFPDNARYCLPHPEKDNIASFEVILWILSQCASVRQARDLLSRMNITKQAYSPQLPPSPLHWILADGLDCAVLEPGTDGLSVYDNPVGILTNNPPFPFQLERLRDYRLLSPDTPAAQFPPGTEQRAYSCGMGTLGLPGDFSSPSRFVRAAFLRCFSPTGETAQENTVQFFRMTDPVRVPRGAVRTESGEMFYTVYTSCYTPDLRCCCSTQENPAITAYAFTDFEPDAASLQTAPLLRKWRIYPPDPSIAP